MVVISMGMPRVMLLAMRTMTMVVVVGIIVGMLLPVTAGIMLRVVQAS